MKSAYVTLGVPGNVDVEGIEHAYSVALGHFSKEKLVANPDLHTGLDEVRDAYKILTNPDLRKAHDRKLSGAVAVPVRMVPVPVKEKSTSSTVLKWMAIVVIAMFATGTYFSHIREEARKAKVAHELALKKAEDEQAAQVARDNEVAEANRARAKAIADNNERQLRAESSVIVRQSQAVDAMQQAVRVRQEEAIKNDARNEARNEERQRIVTAQQRAADDQRRIRSLCMLNYGRPNC